MLGQGDARGSAGGGEAPQAPAALPPSPRTKWRALTVHGWDAGLQANVRRVYGYRGECEACSWLGPVRVTVAGARADAWFHSAAHDEPTAA